MQNLKKYKNFRIDEGFIDSIDSLFAENPVKNQRSESKMTETNTKNLIKYLLKKVEIRQSSPVYIFNQTDSKYPVYVTSELFEQESGMSEEYSYCILNGAKEDLSNVDSIKQGLYSILSKNSSDGKKTIVEISNISAVGDKSKSDIAKMILDRNVLDYSLKDGEFFILTDNSNSSRGGDNIKDQIASILPGVQTDLIYHQIYSNSENPE